MKIIFNKRNNNDSEININNNINKSLILNNHNLFKNNINLNFNHSLSTLNKNRKQNNYY